jgi:hypothetical protein
MSTFVFWGGFGWDDGTALLYIGIGCLVGFLGFVSSHIKDTRQSFLFLFLASLILILFKGFCVSGVDVKFGGGYYKNFISAKSLSSFRDGSAELGYRLLTVAVRCFTNNYGIYLLIVSAVSIAPVIYVLWKLRKDINLSFALMGYSLIFIVTGMSAMRQFMAVGVGVLAVFYYFTKRYGHFVVTLFLAVSIHTSALCLFLLFGFSLVKDRRWLQLFIAFLVVVLCVVGRLAIGSLFTGRYAVYAVGDNLDFGVAVLFKYVPIALLLAAVENRILSCSSDCVLIRDRIANCWTVLVFSACMALIGYVVGIFGRAESFSAPIVIVIAYLIRQCEEGRYFRIPIKVLVFCYFCFRFLLYMNDGYLAEGLMPYLSWI